MEGGSGRLSPLVKTMKAFGFLKRGEKQGMLLSMDIETVCRLSSSFNTFKYTAVASKSFSHRGGARGGLGGL